jgi:hypothetical protein
MHFVCVCNVPSLPLLPAAAPCRDNLDWSTAPAIQEMPVVSAICEPTQQQQFSKYDGEITLKGYAWSGGGRDIVRVDVSTDGACWKMYRRHLQAASRQCIGVLLMILVLTVIKVEAKSLCYCCHC